MQQNKILYQLHKQDRVTMMLGFVVLIANIQVTLILRYNMTLES